MTIRGQAGHCCLCGNDREDGIPLASPRRASRLAGLILQVSKYSRGKRITSIWIWRVLGSGEYLDLNIEH